MAVSINEYDKLTVDMLNRGLKHVDARLKPNYKGPDGKPLSASTIKKLQAMKKKYYYQRGKTFNLYNKYMKREKTKGLLKGLSVNSLSVEKIYAAIGKETKDNAFGAWLRESPGRLLNIVGGGLAVAGSIVALKGLGVKTAILDFLKNLGTTIFGKMSAWQIAGVSLLGAGAMALAVGMTMSKIQKNKFRNASLKFAAQEAMNEGTVRDNDAVLKADSSKIEALASQASVDTDLMQHLSDVIANPNTEPKVAEKAMAIFNKAKIFQQQNIDRATGTQLQTIIEQDAQPGESNSEKLQRFAIYKKLESLIKIVKAAEEIKKDDVTQEKIDEVKSTLDSTNKDYAKKKAKYDELVAKANKYKASQEAVAEIAAIKEKVPTIDIPKGGDENDLDKYTFDKIGASVVESEGIEAILEIAKNAGLSGFSPTTDVTKNKALYEQLCAKYGIDKSIQNIAEIQLKLGGAEKAAE